MPLIWNNIKENHDDPARVGLDEAVLRAAGQQHDQQEQGYEGRQVSGL